MNKLLKRIIITDEKILKFFNIRIKCNLLDMLMTKITYLGSYISCILYSIIIILYSNINIKIIISILLSFLLTKIIKIIIRRNRPFVNIPDLNVKKIDINKYSFPSEHTNGIFTIAMIISLLMPQLTIIVMIFAILVAISRMYIGVHYPSDVLFGIIHGIMIPIIIFNI